MFLINLFYKATVKSKFANADFIQKEPTILKKSLIKTVGSLFI